MTRSTGMGRPTTPPHEPVSMITPPLTVAAVLLGLLTGAGCSATPATHPEPATQPSVTGASSTAAKPIEVVYDDREQTSEGPYHVHAVLIAAGPTHIRYSIKASGFAPMLYVYDGQRLLVHDPEEARPWSLYEAPHEHRDQFGIVSGWFARPGSAEFAKGCRSATVVGHKTILGRTAIGYHCAAQHFRDGSSYSAHVDWLDESTALPLRSGPLQAATINQHPHITGSTFDTQPPAGAQVSVYAAKAQPGGGPRTAPNFQLRPVTRTGTGTGTGTGTISLSDYAGAPLVLAFFDSDLTFDTHGETCPGCVPALLSLQRLTSGGTQPPVLAIQSGDVGKPGYPLIPRDVRLKVANDPSFDVKNAYGLSHEVGFAFIGSDGKILQLIDKAPSEQQIRTALHMLR